MDRLRKVIEQYGRWSVLETYINRIEAHSTADFSHAFENAKALIETVGKEICVARGVEIEPTASINSVLKKAFASVGYVGTDMVVQISSALATIAQQMGELRNDIGITSHGRPLDQIRERNDGVDGLTREFLLDTTVIVAIFLIRAFETQNPRGGSVAPEINTGYADNEEFNEYWDDQY